jgi:serine/threonine protein kinase
MSPEQICADRNISGSADLYSLGCVMYEMLTGHPPFAGANFAQVWEQHLHKPPRPIREQGIDCPDWLERLALQLLAKQPRERPFNARAVEGILRQHLREEFGETWNATVATATPTVRVAADGDHPRRWTLWVVIAAAAAIVLAAALWWN